MAKSKFLKKLLTTASAVAVLAGGVQSASAVVVNTAGAPGNIVIVQGTNSGGALSALLTAGDSISLAAAHDITTGGAITLVAPGINANGNNGQTFNVGHVVTWPGGTDIVNVALNVTAGSITVQDATTRAVTVSGGAVTVRHTLGVGANGRVTVSGGTLAITNANENVLVSGGRVNQTGTVAGDVRVTGTGQYLGAAGAIVAGDVTINTSAVGNTFRNANAVTVTQGVVTFNDAAGRVIVDGGTITAMNDAALGLTISAGEVTALHDITNGGLIASGGLIRALNVIGNGGNALLSGDAIVNQAGTIAGTLDVTGAAQYIGAGGADITGIVTINTTAVGNTFNDAANAVNVQNGKVTFNDANGLVSVTGGEIVAMNDAVAGVRITGGTITTLNDITNAGLTATGGVITTMRNVDNGGAIALSGDAVVTQTGTANGVLQVTGDAKYLGAAGADITGAVTFNTTTAGNTFNDAANTVRVTKGSVSFNDAAALVTVDGGTITAMRDATLGLAISSGTITAMRDVGGAALTATGGTIEALRNVGAHNTVLSGNAVVKQSGTSGAGVQVTGNALYVGGVAANVTGAVTINTTNEGENTFNNAAGATVTKGKVRFNNATALLTVNGGEVVAMNDATNGVTISSGTITSIRDIAGAALTATGGTIEALRNVGAHNTVLSGNAVVKQSGTSGAGVQVTGNSHYLGGAGADVTGLVTINTTSAETNTFNNAVAAVTVTKGKVKFNNAGALVTVNGGEIVAMKDAAAGVTISSGTITSMQDITGGADLTATGGTVLAIRNIGGGRNAALSGNAVVNQTGTIAGTLGVIGNALYLGTTNANDITGRVTINTANEGMNTFHNSIADVIVTAGNLTMNNVGTDLTVNGASSNAIVTGNVVRNLVGGHASARATIAGNVGGTIDQAGIFVFTGAGTVTGVVGGGGAATKIIIDTADERVFTNAGFTTGELNFAQAGTAKLTAAANLAATNVTTDTPNTGKVIVNANQTITGNIGAVDIEAVGARNVDINTANFEANVLANAADQVVVNTGVIASTRVGNLGSNVTRLWTANFAITGGSVGDVYAKNTVVAAGVNQTFRGIVSGIDLTLATNATTATFANGSTVDTAIRSLIAGAGTVDFVGGTTIQKDIGAGGRAAAVKFADDAQFTANLNTDNIFADAIQLRKGEVNLNKNITMNGKTTLASTPLNLNDKKLTVAAGNDLVFSGSNDIEFVITANGDITNGGQIQSNGPLKFTAGTTINITPDDSQTGRPTAGKTRVHTLIVNNDANPVVAGSTLDITKVTVNNDANVFTKWTASIDAKGGLALTQVDNAKQVLFNLLGSTADAVDKVNIAELTSAPQGTDGAKMMDLIQSLKDSSNKLVKAKVDEAFDRLPPVSTVTDAIETTSGAVSMGLSQRMTNLAGSQGTPVQSRTVASSGAVSGVAAGEGDARYGAWVSPFFGKTTQKERKGAAGYNSSSYGASFGFDTRANEDMIIGGAVTVANNELKHKNFKSGDKTKIGSMMFSIYGMQQITDSWFAHGVATFGSNDVKNSEKRVSGLTSYDTVNGKYTSMSFNGEAMFGYNFITEQVTFTPMAGVRYSRVNDGGYKETGSTTGQNIDVKTKAANKFEVVAGARVAGGTFGMNGMTVTPEVHVFANHDLIGKNPKQTLGLGGTNGLTVKSNKPVKTTFNVGIGANFAYNMMEYGIGYDAEIATKRLGHQGTMKLRVNF